MSTLYTIDTELEFLIDKYTDPETWEINWAYYEEIENMIDQKREKMGNIARYILSLDSESEELEKEASRLKERARRISKRAEDQREWIKWFMIKKWERKYQTDIATFSLRKSESLHIFDDSQIPDEFLRIKKEPEKKKIKEAIESWSHFDWATIVQNESLLLK